MYNLGGMYDIAIIGAGPTGQVLRRTIMRLGIQSMNIYGRQERPGPDAEA